MVSGAAPAVTPGNYTTPGPTGGTVSVYGNDPGPYSAGPNGYGFPQIYSYGGPISGTGDITTVYTYHPAGAWDQPKGSVLVTESCVVDYWDSNGLTGYCTDGLGDPEVDTPDNGGIGGDSQGTHYRLVTAGTTVPVTSSPDTEGNAGLFDGCTGDVQYNGSMTPIQIAISGVTVSADGSKLLVCAGQGVTATLTPALSTPWKVSYSWSTPPQTRSSIMTPR